MSHQTMCKSAEWSIEKTYSALEMYCSQTSSTMTEPLWWYLNTDLDT